MTKHPPLAYQVQAVQSPHSFASARRVVVDAFACLLLELRCHRVDVDSAVNTAYRARVIAQYTKMAQEFRNDSGTGISQHRVLQADALFRRVLMQKVMQYTTESTSNKSGGQQTDEDILSDIRMYAAAIRCLSGNTDYYRRLFDATELSDV